MNKNVTLDDEVYFLHDEDAQKNSKFSLKPTNSQLNLDDFRRTNKFRRFKLQALDKRDKIKIAMEVKEKLLNSRRENIK